nr:hypothetical protein [uncultured Pedobacter sp.]
MTTILENSLVLVVLTAFILIPVFIIKRRNKKKKLALLQSELEKITFDNNFKLVHTDTAGNLFIGYSDNGKLLLLNLIDFTYEIVDLEKVVTVKDEINYTGKEVKSVKLLLIFNSGVTKEISFYKQFDDNELELPGIKKLVIKWKLLLTSSL